MPKTKKITLSEHQSREALKMLNSGRSIGYVAKFFGVNKPAIKKAAGVWNTEIKSAPDGRLYKFNHGRIVVYKAVEKKDEKIPEVSQMNVQTEKPKTTEEILENGKK